MSPAQAHREHKAKAHRAFLAYVRLCGTRLPSVPGMDTEMRLAVRIASGRSVAKAAAAEYLYRWSLALQSPIFGVPHTLGT